MPDPTVETVTRLVVRISDSLAAALDGLVERGVAESRSDAVRQALETFLDADRRQRIGDAIVAGYERIPQTEEELAWVDDATRRMISEEPW